MKDWTGKTGGVHANSKRQEELERTDESFRGLRPSAVKIANDDDDSKTDKRLAKTVMLKMVEVIDLVIDRSARTWSDDIADWCGCTRPEAPNWHWTERSGESLALVSHMSSEF